MVTTDWGRDIVERLFRDHPTKSFVVRLWDGSRVAWGSDPRFTYIASELQ
jgi:hypothetical protein